MRQKLATLLSITALVGGMLMVAGTALAANPAATLDQCANGSLANPNDPACDPSEWVNGNLGASKAHYSEGESVPYRLRFSNLATTGPTAVHKVVIEWDTTKGGKHALDYLTTWNRTVTSANPCAGVNGCNLAAPSSTLAIPSDPQVAGVGGAAAGQIGGDLTMWGATLGSVSIGAPYTNNGYYYPNGAGFTGDKSARMEISFTATVANPVLAWSGHIATRLDWGNTNSAVAISGSPFHMRLIGLDGSGGNQDRSLSNDAVIFPAHITVVKHVDVPSTAPFSFTGSDFTPNPFELIDNSATLDPSKLSNDIETFGAHTVAESNPLPGYKLGSIVCTSDIVGGNDFTPTIAAGGAGGSVSIALTEGENVICTFNNLAQNSALSIAKDATESSYDSTTDTIHYTIVATNTGNTTLNNVTITDTEAVLGTCTPANGSTLAPGETISCAASHAVTQADIDAGTYNNTACVDDGAGGATEVCDDADVPAASDPKLSILKTADQSTYDAVGDVITYTITATNTGNVTLASVTVTDPDVDDLVCVPANGSALAPGDSLDCTASHTIDQGDLDAGSFANTACVDDGVGVGGAAEDCDDETVTSVPDPKLSILKTTTFVGKYDAGDTLSYNIKITNTGNVTLLNVVVTDLLVADLACVPTSPVTSLAPGAEINCTASYAIGAGDLGGSVKNEACADDGNGDGATGAASVCDDVTVLGMNQPTINTADVLIPQDSITIAGLTADATGTLYVELQIDGDCGDADPAYSKSWTGAAFTGNGTYDTDNTVAVSSDVTIRWCTSYSGDDNNAARPLDDRGEVVSIDFDPFASAAIGFAIPMLLWGIWTVRRREEKA